MIEPKPVKRLNRVQMILYRLPRKAVHQIRTDVREPGRPCTLIVLHKIRIAMYAPNRFQKSVVCALQPHGQAVNAGRPVFPQFGSIERAGVGFNGNLCIRHNFKRCAQRVHQHCHRSDRQNGRCTAAEKNGIICLFWKRGGIKPHFLQKRGTVFPHAFAVRKRNEIAVAAF